MHTHILVAEEQFLLLINVPIQDCAHGNSRSTKSSTYSCPKGNLSAYYDIDANFLGISYDETKAIEILEQQFTTCQQGNRQFCNNQCTTSTTCQPTIMHHSLSMHQEQSRHWMLMLSTNKEYMQHHYSNTNILKPVDININNQVRPCRH